MDSNDPREDRLFEAIDDYLRSRERREATPRAEWLRRYADVASKLEEFLNDHEGIQEVCAPDSEGEAEAPQLPVGVFVDASEVSDPSKLPVAQVDSAAPADGSAASAGVLASERGKAMQSCVTLMVTAGPHKGQSYSFTEHDTFIVGRSERADFQLKPDNKQRDARVSRVHFLIEVNPPLCRLMDLASKNKTWLNGKAVEVADLKTGDEIRIGQTLLRAEIRFPEEVQARNTKTVLPELPRPEPGPSPDAIEGPARCLACGRGAELQGMFCAACRARARKHPQPVPGYVLFRELGRGGMGVVCLAGRESDGAAVALKMIVPQVATSSKYVERFLREARILAELDHPHVVRFLDMGAAGGLLWFAMEYVQGTDVKKLLKQKGPLAVTTAVRLVNQALKALEYAHARTPRGVVHRDIKPANLLLGRKGNTQYVKLADFGLARVYEASQLSGITLIDDVGGTLGFMPPEQVKSFRDVRPTADQYSMAATLYNLLTNRFPYDFPKSFAAQMGMVLTKDPVPIVKRRADLPPRLAEAIHRGLARNPAERFADVAAMRKALLPFAR